MEEDRLKVEIQNGCHDTFLYVSGPLEQKKKLGKFLV
jgi:hypothetical protein